MLKTLFITAFVAFTLLLAGCQSNNAPSSPPTTSKDSGWVRAIHKNEKSETENIWAVIGKEFELTKYEDNPRVKTQIAFYTKNKQFFEMVSTNAEPYLYQVFEEVKKADLPTEMIILPMIESGFDPYVYSSGKAAGIWQFVPGTGKLYGLKQANNYDGRRDIQASTQAAVKYLRALNEAMNGDWLLTLAAYNSGEGAIKRAIEANRRQGKKTDFFSLHLSKETQLFVPNILAISKMLSDPERYGINLHFIPYSPYSVEVKLPHNSGFKEIAASSKVDVTDLKRLNPGYTKSANTIDKQYAFLVPMTAVDQFDSASIPFSSTVDKVEIASASKSIRSKTTHVVKQGDNIKNIALMYHISTKALTKANNISTSTTLEIGQLLTIPPSTAYSVTSNASSKVSYRIQTGDTLSEIAKQFNVAVSDLKKWNPLITGKQNLAMGDVLTIYPKAR